jgi:lathosterol oxidase
MYIILETISRFVIYIFSYDVWFYISHLALHTKTLFNSVHYIHHTPNYTQMTYKSTYVGHYFESLFQSLGTFFPIIFINFDLMELFYVIVFLNIRGMLRHDFRLTWLIGNHHILHHKYPYCNYGEYYLDYLFNTNYKKNISKL